MTAPLGTYDLEILRRTVWGEVRNQQEICWRGVTWSVRNRLALPKKYGSTVAEVCQRPGQYDCWHPGSPRSPGWGDWLATITASGKLYDELCAVVEAAWQETSDPTDGATHYYTDGIAAPYWVPVSVFTVKLDREFFYKGVP